MVAEITTGTNYFASAFKSLKASPLSWLNQIRENAFARFEEAGFPTVKDEEWKYTNVAPIVKAGFARVSGNESPVASNLIDPQANQLVFVNGKLQKRLSSFEAAGDLVALNLSDAVADSTFGPMVRAHLARHADYVKNSFTALNTAFIEEGALVYVPKGVTIGQPLVLSFLTNKETSSSATFPRVLVLAEENSNLTLVESYRGPDDSQYLTAAVVEIVLKDGARVEHYKVQREGAEAFHIANTTADLGRNASYDSTTITLGARLSRHDIAVTMDNEGAECWVDGLYLVSSSQHTDTHSVIDHRKPHCTSHQLYKGILDEKSRAVFNGKIFVRHNAQKTDAMQTNKNLLLSDEARVDTKPQLEILADDVKCAHGAAVGQIEADELFYLETRGIHPELARNLLTYGFAEEVINKIRIDSIKNQLDQAVLNRLNTQLEA